MFIANARLLNCQILVINPWHACARVTVVVLCVCVCVCLCVRVFYSALLRFKMSNKQYQWLQREKYSKIKKQFSLEQLSLKVRSIINSS